MTLNPMTTLRRTMSRFIACLVAAAVLAGCGFAAAPQKSEAAVLVGIGEQNASMFSNPLFTQIGFKRARYFPSWNVAQKPEEATWLDQWLAGAQSQGVEPLISFFAALGSSCPSKPCTLPTVRQYTKAFKAFHKRWPQVKVISPWNEANHRSQPTFKNPKRAAQYYNVVRKYCRHLEGALRPDSGRLRTSPVDIGREEQVRALLAGTGPLDHVVVTAADAAGAYAPLPDFDLEAARAVLGTKLLGPWLVAKHAAGQLPPTGSITFTSGIAAYRPAAGSSMIASANGALEALARALAVELAPIRVNVVSPGWVDTPIWDTLAGDAKPERLAAMAARLPAGRVGTPADLAAAYAAVLDNGFVTGTVVHVDGGHRLV